MSAIEKMGLPEWPTNPRETFPPGFNVYSDQWRAAVIDYHAARADAALARLRVAVDVLRPLLAECDESVELYLVHNDDTVERAREALALIGPLPTDETTPPPRRDV